MTPLEWATSTFGPVARNRDERAARLVEEAIEFAHAEGVTRETMLGLVERVFESPPGETLAELQAVAMTLDAAAENLGYTSIENLSTFELERVMCISQAEWDRRHANKVAKGLANLSEVKP